MAPPLSGFVRGLRKPLPCPRRRNRCLATFYRFNVSFRYIEGQAGVVSDRFGRAPYPRPDGGGREGGSSYLGPGDRPVHVSPDVQWSDSPVTAKRRAEGPAVKRKPKPPGNTKRRALKVLKWFLIVSLAGTLILIGAFVYLYQTTSIPNPNKDFQTQSSFVYYADGKSQVGQYATQNRQSISYSDMSPNLRNAVVAAEDRSFWTNHGIDPKGIIRAAFNDARGGATQGASTITQQYVKILYLTQQRSVSRKIHEAILSLKLQQQLSKEKILEGYPNTIYFGRGAYGVQAAAQAYFGVDATDLTLKQSAVLASVLNNPSAFDPANGKKEKKALE